jgi:hypothetical protein
MMTRTIRSLARRALPWIAVLALLAGCGRIPLASLWQLRQFSFERFEPDALRLALHLPAAYSMARDALRIEARVQRDGEPARSEHFVLRESADPAEGAGLPPVSAAGGRWVVLRLDAGEAERVRAFRRLLTAVKAQPGQRGSLALNASPQLCRTGVAAAGEPQLSGALRWSHDKGYVPLLRDVELDELLKSLPQPVALGSLPHC